MCAGLQHCCRDSSLFHSPVQPYWHKNWCCCTALCQCVFTQSKLRWCNQLSYNYQQNCYHCYLLRGVSTAHQLQPLFCLYTHTQDTDTQQRCNSPAWSGNWRADVSLIIKDSLRQTVTAYYKLGPLETAVIVVFKNYLVTGAGTQTKLADLYYLMGIWHKVFLCNVSVAGQRKKAVQAGHCRTQMLYLLGFNTHSPTFLLVIFLTFHLVPFLLTSL